jgi:hypothetical protein
LWALTDHDEIGGQARAAAAAREQGMHYLTGTEISVSFIGRPCISSAWDSTPMTGCAKAWQAHPRRPRPARPGHGRGPGQGRHQGRLRRRAQFAGNHDLISRTHFARFPGRDRRVQGNQRGVPQVPDRGQAGLRRTPLGHAQGRGHLDHRMPAAWRSSRTRRATGFTPNEELRCSPSSRTMAARGRSGHRQSQRRRIRDLRRAPRASSAWPHHAAATSTARTNRIPTWARCPCCPAELTPVWDLLESRIR